MVNKRDTYMNRRRLLDNIRSAIMRTRSLEDSDLKNELLDILKEALRIAEHI